MSRRLGVLGGTFDPIHHGHLVAAQEALHQLELDRVLFVPVGQPPHKLDEPLSSAEVVADGHVPVELWDRVETAAIELFRRGSERGLHAGLILADTKFEFGVDRDGELLLIDEALTPDSSRWWVEATYDERLAAGEEPESLDKEVVRRALADAGYTGDGRIPELPAEVWHATASRYVDAFERRTGTAFVPGAYPVAPRINAALAGLDID